MTIPAGVLVSRLTELMSIMVPWSTIYAIITEMATEPFPKADVNELNQYLVTHKAAPSDPVKNLIRCRLRIMIQNYICLFYSADLIPAESVSEQNLGKPVLETHPVVG
jgi:hypothetical protein